MAQIIDSLPSEYSGRILCSYMNETNVIEIVRITNIPKWHFERVVFPEQRLLFEALPEAQLQIYTGVMASTILSDRIPCERLQVTEGVENR